MGVFAITSSDSQALGLTKRACGVYGTRDISKKHLPYNDATPTIEVDPQTYEVRVDGKPISAQPAERLALAQRYFLF